MKAKSKRGRPPGKQKYNAWLAIPMNKEFYNKFRIIAQAEDVSAAELGRKILRGWMLQKGQAILKDAFDPAKVMARIDKVNGNLSPSGKKG